MQTSALPSISQYLFSDLDPLRDYSKQKPLLAHYCTVDTAEKILNGREIWLSNPLFMNDLEEVRFGMLNAAYIFTRIVESSSSASESDAIKTVQIELNRLHSSFDRLDAIDIYALCFSRQDKEDNDGLLSMWRGYGGNGRGAALVFDTSKIPPIEDSPFILAEVHYANNEDRLRWLEDKISGFVQIICSCRLSNDDLLNSAEKFFERIKLFTLFSKHKGFCEEREWRLVYIKARDKRDVYRNCLSYQVGSSGIEPKLKVKIEALFPQGTLVAEDDLIERIILGPTHSSHLSRVAFGRMLETIGRPALKEKTVASAIPYRP